MYPLYLALKYANVKTARDRANPGEIRDAEIAQHESSLPNALRTGQVPRAMRLSIVTYVQFFPKVWLLFSILGIFSTLPVAVLST